MAPSRAEARLSASSRLLPGEPLGSYEQLVLGSRSSTSAQHAGVRLAEAARLCEQRVDGIYWVGASSDGPLRLRVQAVLS